MYQKLLSTYRIYFNPLNNTESQKLLMLFLQMRILRAKGAPNFTQKNET